MSSGPAFGRRCWILALKKASCNSWTTNQIWRTHINKETRQQTLDRKKERSEQNKQTNKDNNKKEQRKKERKKERRKERSQQNKTQQKNKKTQYWDTVPLLFRFVFFVDIFAKPSCPHQSPNLAINKMPQLQIAHGSFFLKSGNVPKGSQNKKKNKSLKQSHMTYEFIWHMIKTYQNCMYFWWEFDPSSFFGWSLKINKAPVMNLETVTRVLDHHKITLHGTNLSHLVVRKIFKSTLGYVSSQEGT